MRHSFVSLLALGFCALAAAPLAPRAHAATKPLVVVVAASSGMKDISTASLRRVFQGLPTEFEGAKRFVPLNHPTGTLGRVQFDDAVLGLQPSAVGAFWIDRKIRDESPPPRTVPSAELAMKIAGSLPGAITYIAPEMLSPAVKALTIDGKAAGMPGYLLK